MVVVAIVAASYSEDGQWQGQSNRSTQRKRRKWATVALRSTQTRKDRRMGRNCLALDKARCGVYYAEHGPYTTSTLCTEVSRRGES